MRRKINLKQLRTLPTRFTYLSVALVLIAWIVVPVLFGDKASAASAQLQNRRLTISSSANGTITTDIAGNAVAAGAGGNGQKTQETFEFNIPSAQNVGSVLIKFCDDPIPIDATSGPADGTCNDPTGFNAATVTTIQSQQADTTTQDGTNYAALGTPFSVDTSTVLTGAPWGCDGASPGRKNCIAIKRTATAFAANDKLKLVFGGTASDYITNPSTDNAPFFARIQLYTDNAFTTKADYGSVAGSTAQQIDITAKVKEVLNFSVGNATSLVAPGTTCTPLTTGANTGAIALGDSNGVLSFNVAYDAHSYFRLSTNTNGGVNVYYSGNTLKNGANDINAIGLVATSSTVNTEQFGLAIDNSDTQAGNGYSFTNLHAIDNVTYTNPDGTDYSAGAGTITSGGTAKFAFNVGSATTPVMIATSSGVPVSCDTGSVRYIGNISTATPAGIYTTTLTYIATGTY